MIYVRRKPLIQTMVPHLDTSPRRTLDQLNSVKFTPKEEKLLEKPNIVLNEENKNYDLVYIVKESEKNSDLKYSLRSICKFCSFKNVWIIGYKPRWVTNVKYLHTRQTGNKWKNSMVNYEAACNCPEISDNFILMNDDFFAIRPIINWKEDTNKCLGTIEEKAAEYKAKKAASRWQNGFIYAEELLKELDCKHHFNYETHLPIIINKANFKKMLEMPTIKTFMQTDKVFHKRSMYKNLFYDEDLPEPKKIIDVKLELQKDLNSLSLTENWVSVYDYVVDNCRKYPRINKFLRAAFSDKCRFEV